MFEVPNNEKHAVYYSKTKDGSKLVWVEIVDPQAVYESENPTLPDITVKIKDKTYSLKGLIDLLVVTK